MGFPLTRKGSPASSLPLAGSVRSASFFFPQPLLLFFVSILQSPKGNRSYSSANAEAWTGGRPQPWAFLSVDNIVAALKDRPSTELCGKAGSKWLKCFMLRLVDKALILSSSVSLVPS